MTLWALGHPLLSDDKGTAIPNEDKNLEEVAIYIISPREWNAPRTSFAFHLKLIRYVEHIQRCLSQQYISGVSRLYIHKARQFLAHYSTNVGFCWLFLYQMIFFAVTTKYTRNLIILKLKVWEKKTLSLYITGWRCAIYVFVTTFAFGSKKKHTID